MTFCPVCKSEVDGEGAVCTSCGADLKQNLDDWIVIGTTGDKISADFAKEILESNEIPAVVISKSGFFGTAGLPLVPFYTSESAAFEVSVPEEFGEEASELLEMTLGSKWQRKEQ